ncbi:putative inactive poly [ADP-ribose] polymerase SRO2 isoform X2 [Nicotiana tabacum]|uniref:Inactive poly [ADP-ribose] polymerase SRO2 isoform X2 n=4 Tax=Nicotiana TaxID=4085 RepID=A0A1S4B6T4_TOBAC|nr:PREDICTED: probable inactive poly [ADP-ribose] polymerase SRO2 isoform X1 [Nicotiana sylvestris]XP_016484579.1 PREDICTED: probable inactive poly [ADP-ribose] polymerase SRO2 isoform X1 [Nicotiana tabacum]
MEQLREEDQVSMTIENPEMLLSSDSEAESSSNPRLEHNFRLFKTNGMIKLEENNKEHGLIKSGFITCMGPLAKQVEVVAIHKNSCSTLLGKARLEAFRIFSEAVREKCNGNANIKYAWFGSSKEEIGNIISHGFSTTTEPKSGECFGIGVYLYPANFDGVLSAVEDENGLRHMLLCRVILGNTEEIAAGSTQSQPTSEEFDSGVDNIVAPTTYTIWASHMNSHIFPNFLVSFRCPNYLLGSSKIRKVPLKPTPRIKFPDLLRALSKFLHPSRMASISKYYEDFQRSKITKLVLVRKLRQIAGDTSLRAVMKLYPHKDIGN